MSEARLLRVVPVTGIPISRGGPLRAGGVGQAVAPQKARLLDQVRDAIRTRHMSVRTEEAYVGWIRQFVLFHGKRHPVEMGKPEVSAFLSSLATDGHVSASTQNQLPEALARKYPTRLRHGPVGRGLRHPDNPGASRPLGRHDDDLHARPQPWGARCDQSGGSAVMAGVCLRC
jgi:hypothetical protein